MKNQTYDQQQSSAPTPSVATMLFSLLSVVTALAESAIEMDSKNEEHTKRLFVFIKKAQRYLHEEIVPILEKEIEYDENVLDEITFKICKYIGLDNANELGYREFKNKNQ